MHGAGLGNMLYMYPNRCIFTPTFLQTCLLPNIRLLNSFTLLLVKTKHSLCIFVLLSYKLVGVRLNVWSRNRIFITFVRFIKYFSSFIYTFIFSVVVEICPYGNDGRCLLGGGPFNRLAAVMGHNYLVHHPPYQEYAWFPKIGVSEFNISRLMIHITNFLASIGWVL